MIIGKACRFKSLTICITSSNNSGSFRVPFDVEVSRYYMQYFNFDNYKLDDAVRVFVERAPLIGQSCHF